MSFHSFWIVWDDLGMTVFRNDENDLGMPISLIPGSFWSFRAIPNDREKMAFSHSHPCHSDVIPFILSCLRWPRNDFISEWREWPWNANFSHSRLILVILCYPRWSRKDGIFPFSSLSFRCHSVIRTSFWDQESIEMRSEWQIILGRSRQSSLHKTLKYDPQKSALVSRLRNAVGGVMDVEGSTVVSSCIFQIQISGSLSSKDLQLMWRTWGGRRDCLLDDPVQGGQVHDQAPTGVTSLTLLLNYNTINLCSIVTSYWRLPSPPTVAQLQGSGADNGQQTTREPPWQRQHLQHSHHQPTPSQPMILLIWPWQGWMPWKMWKWTKSSFLLLSRMKITVIAAVKKTVLWNCRPSALFAKLTLTHHIMSEVPLMSSSERCQREG